MKRVLIIGSGGAGKSTLALQVGARLGIPVVHLDALFWNAGWVATPHEEWNARVADMLARPTWVMDGNYGRTLRMRIDACDAVIFLDMPRLLCMARVIKRWLRYRGRTRPDMSDGCPEKVDREFLLWLWNYPRQSRPNVMELLEGMPPGKRLYILRSRADVERFVAGLPSPAGVTA